MTPTDRPTREDALLPCPFCGGNAEFSYASDLDDCDVGIIECKNFGCFSNWAPQPRDEMIAGYNTRAGIVIDRDKVPLTDELLGGMGFKWSQEERQPEKHWSLTLGWGAPNTRACHEDLSVEIAGGAMDGEWFCWLRRGTRFSDNFLHVRHIKYWHEVEEIITALTGTKWKRENSMYGNFYNDEITAKMRPEYERISSAALLAEKSEG